jgi:hypothetical protein
MSHGKFVRIVELSALLLAACAASPVHAQATPNPLQSFKDALNKVIKQAPGQAPAQAQPQAAPQPQAQAGLAQPSASATAPVAAATPVAASAPSGGTQTWTPPAETGAPVQSKGPLDPAKLPDIGGVHIGDNPEHAVTALKKIHTGAQITPIPQSPNMPSAGVTLSFGSYQPPPSWDNTSVTFTFDSGQQSVYSVYRDVRYEPNISKQNLVDALRQKYGKETAAAAESSLEAGNDTSIAKMWWLIDEQGHVQHPSRLDPVTHSPGGCREYAGGAEGVSTYRTTSTEYVAGRLPAANFCDSLIMLLAVFDRGSVGGTSRLDLVGDSRILLFDTALMRRSAVAMGDAQMGQARKQRQNDLKKANEARPNL